MSNEQTIIVIDKMGQNGKLDAEIIELVKAHHEAINQARIEAQEKSRQEYRAFLGQLSSGAAA